MSSSRGPRAAARIAAAMLRSLHSPACAARSTRSARGSSTDGVRARERPRGCARRRRGRGPAARRTRSRGHRRPRRRGDGRPPCRARGDHRHRGRDPVADPTRRRPRCPVRGRGRRARPHARAERGPWSRSVETRPVAASADPTAGGAPFGAVLLADPELADRADLVDGAWADASESVAAADAEGAHATTLHARAAAELGLGIGSLVTLDGDDPRRLLVVGT